LTSEEIAFFLKLACAIGIASATINCIVSVYSIEPYIEIIFWDFCSDVVEKRSLFVYGTLQLYRNYDSVS
jgi:hypothetical protein